MSESRRREDTCSTNCPFFKRYGYDCPNYVKGVWRPNESNESYETHDCAPKRTMILSQQIFDVTCKLLKNYNEVRNANHEVLKQTLRFQVELPNMLSQWNTNFLLEE